ncbi:cholecystokinin receptor type A-like [Mercenaria mercenaria]|uniref:cholecystokinin receptor type A-like n=1 Tax=Mercenaria mercenaria TaxID=6596 RepID=UPI00234ED887|nr:cholecystokinin receptor type A-like [Mercenaria mercenaria]XP_045182075.2 cholecystokinin receptor type A-like [Mercenaria mercenaria]
MSDSEVVTNASRISSPDTERLLQEAHRKKVEEHIPLITVLFIIAFVGIIGNILTIIFYGYRVKMTSTIALIRLLAILDLIVCFLCFTTIADLFVNILFTDEILCKVMYFFDHWFVVSSVFTLWIISIDRYRRMCKPLGKQLTVKSATVAVIITSVFSMVFSSHDFITYSPVKVNISTSDKVNPYITGHYCTNTDSPDLHLVVIVFHVLDALTITACFVTFVFTYGNIWRELRNHNRRTVHLHKSSSALSRQSTSDFNSKTLQSDEDVENDRGTTVPLTKNQAVHFSLGSNINTEILNVSAVAISTASSESKFATECVENVRRVSKSSKTSRSERRLTIMMFAVTVGFAICFTPYFIVTVGIRQTSATTEDELHTGIEFALRSPFWNSVINPIIFCVFNTQYRRYMKDVFTKCQINKSTVNSSQG